eukprot:6184783-Pleurochrysis_carterae.AAC.3
MRLRLTAESQHHFRCFVALKLAPRVSMFRFLRASCSPRACTRPAGVRLGRARGEGEGAQGGQGRARRLARPGRRYHLHRAR